MGWLFNKKKVIDLTEQYKDQQDKIAIAKKKEAEKASSSFSPLGAFSMFGAQTSTTTISTPSYSDSSNESDPKRKLAKRIMDMTDQLESLSNQLYHLQQRVELIEKKMSSGY